MKKAKKKTKRKKDRKKEKKSRVKRKRRKKSGPKKSKKIRKLEKKKVRKAVTKKTRTKKARRKIMREEDLISKRLSEINKKLKGKGPGTTSKRKISRAVVKGEKTKSLDVTKVKKPPKGDVVEKYLLNIDKAKVIIKIIKSPEGLTYNLHVPDIGLATASMINEIRNELVSVTSISMAEMMDPASIGKIKNRFMKQATNLLKEKIPSINPIMLEFLIGKLMQDMLGLGEIEFLVNDTNLEEIVIPSSKEPIRVYHKKYGWIKTNLNIYNEEDIVNYSNIVARRVGRQITVLNPLLDAHLVSGDRVNSILPIT